MPDFTMERAAAGVVAGVDEAGRGPLAGPVVAAAVVFTRCRAPRDLVRELDDSKKLSPAVRLRLCEAVRNCARVGVGVADVDEIDRLNILRASLLAMARAVEALGLTVDLALVDGAIPPPLVCPVRCVVGGDGLCLSIAAASVVAKVTRDAMMREFAERFPGYGWEHNAGYGTRMHRDALASLGPTPLHRRSFRPVADLVLERPL
ncbi:MAG: ribonuclease HII [Rhodospirillales bacterium]|nr:ribonuclease HII [Rhodospirillales bacterium]